MKCLTEHNKNGVYQIVNIDVPIGYLLCVSRINKQRDRSFEFSLILATVDLSKHLFMVESFESSYSSSIS